VEVGAVEGLIGTDARLSESGRFRIGIRVVSRITDAAARPESTTAHFMGIGFTSHAIRKMGDSARMLRRGPTRKARDRQIKGAPEEMHRTAFADKV